MFFNRKKSEEVQAPIAIEAPADILPEIEEEPVAEQPEEKLTPINKTTIGKGIVFNGDFSGADPIEINGTINGDISTSCALTISEDGSYVGNARIAEFASDGKVTGTIVCGNLSVLGESSVMDGSLTTAFLETKKGSAFSGTLEMCKPEEVTAKAAGILQTAAEEPEAAEENVPADELGEDLVKFADEVGEKMDIPDFFDLPDEEQK